MPAPKAAPTRDTLNLRIKAEDEGLIDRAAQLAGKTKTDFVLDAARHAPMDALLDRTNIVATPEALEAFDARLDKAPRPNAKLRRALTMPAPWD